MSEKMTIKYVGTLHSCFEMEGIVLWSIIEDNEEETVRLIESGDNLTIFDHDGSIIFKGEIIPDKQFGFISYEGRRAAGLGIWIDWIQKGFQPDDWAKFFYNSDEGYPFQAELEKMAIKHTGVLGSKIRKRGDFMCIWTFIVDCENGENVLEIESGDFLTIYDYDSKTKIFDGEIDFEFKCDRVYGPACCVQRGFDIKVWAKLFVRQNSEKPLRAELVRLTENRKTN